MPLDRRHSPARVTARRALRTRSPLALALVLVACGSSTGSTGNPATGGTTYAVGVTVTTVGPGETFRFLLSNQAISVTQGGVSVKFSQALASGTAYSVNQTDGPRSCNLSSNHVGTIAANVEITADCGVPPSAGALAGELHGPVGTAVVLQVNGGDDLSLTIPAFQGSADPYNLLPFQFATPLASGAAYQVSVKTAPAGQSCSVYKGATGTTPIAIDGLRAGCEWVYDHVSRNISGTVRGTYFESSAPVIGGAATALGTTVEGYGEGRFVAFVSSADLGGNSAGRRQVWWRDALSGETLLISATTAGVAGNGDSFAPAISADGLTVVFESHASNLVSGDTNGVRDVFLWTAQARQAGAQRISVGAGGVQANSESYEPTVSGDGRVVAFSSGASNLTAGVSGTSTINVYRQVVATGANLLVTADLASGAGVGGARPALSEDGNRLAFYSFSSRIVPGDTNGLWDIFVYDDTTKLTERVSLTSTGGERNQGTESMSRVVSPAISGDGRFVAFATTATNMVPGDTNGLQDVFVMDTQTHAVKRASLSSSGIQGDADSPIGQGERVSLSYDGSWIAFTSNATTLGAPAGNVFLHNSLTGETRAASSRSGNSASGVALSRQAAYVAFGAANALDARSASTGLFSNYTGLAHAWWWY